jgi:RNA polymerase sigma factor (sigma-70 family)
MHRSHHQLKLNEGLSEQTVPAERAGGIPRSNDREAGNRPAPSVRVVPRPDAHREPMTGSDCRARFASVVLPHLADAYGLARWLTGNGSDAEDVVQDACVRAFRGIAKFANGDARAWVLTIVRNTAYGWLRKNRPATLLLVGEIESVEQTQSGEPDLETAETALIAKADAGLLEAAIAALPAPFRETLVLRDLQGLAYREIACATQVPVGTVMSRLARARRRLIATIARDAA